MSGINRLGTPLPITGISSRMRRTVKYKLGSFCNIWMNKFFGTKLKAVYLAVLILLSEYCYLNLTPVIFWSMPVA